MEDLRSRTCCFTGHREILKEEYEEIKQKAENEIIKLIKSGVKYFGVGGARGFDALAAKAVLEAKEKYPHIKLILVLPCADQTKGWKYEDKKEHILIKERADKVRILSEKYYNGCMFDRNRHLVNCSGFCICYLRKDTGGTAYTVEYALKNNLNIIYV